jgi:hypothetical protein
MKKEGAYHSGITLFVCAELEVLRLRQGLTLFEVNILAASNPGSSGSDQTHYDTKY